MSSIKIFTDGGARGNPGPAASAFVAIKDGKKIGEGSKYIGEDTNNVAEYMAVILAIDWLLSSKFEDDVQVNFLVDSQLLVRQVNGTYKVKNSRLKNLHSMVISKMKKTGLPIKFVHVKREKNERADSLVNDVLDENMR